MRCRVAFIHPGCVRCLAHHQGAAYGVKSGPVHQSAGMRENAAATASISFDTLHSPRSSRRHAAGAAAVAGTLYCRNME